MPQLGIERLYLGQVNMENGKLVESGTLSSFGEKLAVSDVQHHKVR
jgi:hypothetical protein